ncbi:MAG: methyltransferase family protein [Anaerolineae bacterium]
MKRDRLISLVHTATWLVVAAISLAFKTPTLLAPPTATVAGIIVFALGLTVFAWAVAYLRLEALGIIEPVSEKLLEVGPYKYVRHPIYLGLIIALIGLALALNSLWGVVATLVLFVPVSIYRARLEEAAVARRFGDRWDNYVRDTYFMIPPVY